MNTTIHSIVSNGTFNSELPIKQLNKRFVRDNGDLVKVMAWYDNEWGFTNQMIRQIQSL